MISPAEIKQKAEKLYPAYLSSLITGEPFFPKVIRANKSLTEKSYTSLQQELTPLLQHSKEKIGYGYIVIRRKVNSPRYGEQELPEEIRFDTAADFLKWLGREKEAAAFNDNARMIVSRYPQLAAFVSARPLKVIEHNGDWPDLLKVCDYFVQHPRPGLYIRELPIAVDTKFVENKKSILAELLVLLIPQHINTAGKTFEEKFHLKKYQPYIHLRILDPAIAAAHFSGLTDIGITPAELSALHIRCKRVIILENKQSFKNIDVFLSLPQLAGTIALFGSGFHAGALRQVQWLSEKELLYWGDIDVQGLQILSQLRSIYPHVKSFLMDRETFSSLPAAHVKGTKSDLKQHSLNHLTQQETELFNHLLSLGEEKSRLEQERIPQGMVVKALELIVPA